MSLRKALITGGAGLVGSHIADLLAADETCEEIVILDNLTRGRVENLALASGTGKVRLVEGDIRNAALVREVMRNVDVVFHQAAIRITHSAEDPRLALEVLVEGTFNVVEAAMKAGVNKVVAASSASVYGLAEEFPTAEKHHPYANETLYGAAKLFNEGLLKSFGQMYSLPYVALRYFNVYGPRMDTYGAYTEVLIRWMSALSEGKACTIFGDGSQTMDFIYIEDIARANILAAKSDLTGETFNIASGEETSLNGLAAMLTRVMGSNLAAVHGPARKVNPVSRRLADTTKAEQLLGFRADVGLEEGLTRLVDWWKREALVTPQLTAVS